MAFSLHQNLEQEKERETNNAKTKKCFVIRHHSQIQVKSINLTIAHTIVPKYHLLEDFSTFFNQENRRRILQNRYRYVVLYKILRIGYTKLKRNVNTIKFQSERKTQNVKSFQSIKKSRASIVNAKPWGTIFQCNQISNNFSKHE